MEPIEMTDHRTPYKKTPTGILRTWGTSPFTPKTFSVSPERERGERGRKGGKGEEEEEERDE